MSDPALPRVPGGAAAAAPTVAPRAEAGRPRAGGPGRGAWALLLGAALLLRIASAAANPLIQRDGITFLALARAAREGDAATLLSHAQHPLYSALVALSYPLFGDWELTGLAISITAATLTVIPVVLLGNRVFGAPAGLLGGWLFAASRYPARYGGAVLGDGLQGLLFATAAWAGAVALGLGEERKRFSGFGPWPSFLAAGLASGLAYLVRPEGLIIGLCIATLAAVRTLEWRGRAFLDLLPRAAVLGLALAVTAGPYAAYLSREAGSFRLTRKKSVLESIAATAKLDGPPAPAAGPSPRSAEPAPDARALAAPAGGGSRLVGVLRCLRDFAEGLGWIPAGLVVIGLCYHRLHRGSLLAELYLLLPLAAFVTLLSGVYVIAGYTSRRHSYPAGLIVEGFAGLGLVAVGTALARRWPAWRLGPRAPALLAGLAVLAMAPRSAGLFSSPRDEEKDLRIREAGLALRASVAPADRVLPLASAERAAFYSGGRVLFPSGGPLERDLDRAFAEARERGARWVLLETSPEPGPPPPPPGWRLELRVTQGERELRLYRGDD